MSLRLLPIVLALLAVCSSTACAVDDASTDDDAIDETNDELGAALPLGQTVVFDRFAVTVRNAEQRSLPGSRRTWVGIDVKVCARGNSEPVTWSPWSLLGPEQTTKTDLALPNEKLPWPASQLYPRSDRLRAGECAKGIIPFDNADGEASWTRVRYRNSIGNKAVWKTF